MPSCLQEVKLQVAITRGFGECGDFSSVPAYSLALNAVTCLEARKGEQIEPQALIPAAKEIKLS